MYVIGTEVPVPGGAHETLDALTPTSPTAARATIVAHREAFERAGLHDVWHRVVALVVQPGVEFDHVRVVDYERRRHRRSCGPSSTDEPRPGLRGALHRLPDARSGCASSSRTTGRSSRSDPA